MHEQTHSAQQLCTVAEYLETKTGKFLFPSTTSFDWYLRKHKAHLVNSGAIFVLRGKWHVIPEKVESAVMDIGSKLAAQKLAA